MSTESVDPEPDILDAFFAEIAQAESQFAAKHSDNAPNTADSTSKSPEDVKPVIDGGEVEIRPESSTDTAEKSLDAPLSTTDNVVPEVSPRSPETIPIKFEDVEEKQVASPVSTKVKAETEIEPLQPTSEPATVIAAAIQPVIQDSPASPPSHDFSIEDLVSQDIDHHKLPPASTDQALFKRPVSPNLVTPSAVEEPSSRADDPAETPLRPRKEVRSAPPPPPKCLLSQQKRRRPETDSAHLSAILKTLFPGGRLLIPDAVLVDYLDEAGLDVADTKVPRLLGVAAEHHSASIIQDVFQIYGDGQQDRKRQGKEKDGAGSRPDKKERSKGKMGRPPSGSPKPPKKKGTINKDRKKGTGDSDDPDRLLGDSAVDFDREKGTISHPEEDGIPSSSSDKAYHSGSNPPSTAQPEAMEADGDAYDKSEARSIISKDERESERGGGAGGGKKESKREREKEVEKRHILTLDLLAPVLREQGYHLGYPPYFVN